MRTGVAMRTHVRRVSSSSRSGIGWIAAARARQSTTATARRERTASIVAARPPSNSSSGGDVDVDVVVDNIKEPSSLPSSSSSSSSSSSPSSPSPPLLTPLFFFPLFFAATTSVGAGGLLGSGFDPTGPSSVASALGVLAAVVAVHEAGHFSVARALGVRVSTFALGFGPALYSKKDEKTGVDFTIRAIPLGGYVAFPDDEIEEQEAEERRTRGMSDREREQYEKDKAARRKNKRGEEEGERESTRPKISPDDPDLLKNRPLRDRAAVISAGVAANLAAAGAVLLLQASTVGVAALDPSPGAAIPRVSSGSVAAAAGVRPGDVLLAIDGKELPGDGRAVDVAVAAIRDSPGQELTLRLSRAKEGVSPSASASVSASSAASSSSPTAPASSSTASTTNAKSPQQLSGYVDTNGIERDPARETLDVVVVPAPSPSSLPNRLEEGRIGVQLATAGRVRHVSASTPGAAVSLAAREYKRLSGAVLKGLWALFSDPAQASKAVAGPVAIVAAGAEAARQDAAGIFQFAAIVNINLAVVNLLPLPALDGGYLALIFLEAVRGGKKLPKEVEAAVMASGLLLLMAAGVILIVRDTAHLAGL